MNLFKLAFCLVLLCGSVQASNSSLYNGGFVSANSSFSCVLNAVSLGAKQYTLIETNATVYNANLMCLGYDSVNASGGAFYYNEFGVSNSSFRTFRLVRSVYDAVSFLGVNNFVVGVTANVGYQEEKQLNFVETYMYRPLPKVGRFPKWR